MTFKKPQPKLALHLAILFALIATSCGHVTINDQEWCGDLGDHASCFHTLRTDNRDVPKAEWDKMRFGMVCTQADNFAEVKAVIEKLCQKTRRCTYDDKQKVARFFNHVSDVSNAQKRMMR